MTDPLLLTREEVQEITHRKHQKRQSEVLRLLGVNHLVRPDGSLAVSRQHVEEVLSGNTAGKQKTRMTGVEPDWSKI